MPIKTPVQLYKPYAGGGGPTEPQIKANNAALLTMIQALGFPALMSIMHEVDATMRSDDDFEVIVVPVMSKKPRRKLRRVQLTISYDRWGFVADGHDEVDQAPLGTVLEFLLAQWLPFHDPNEPKRDKS